MSHLRLVRPPSALAQKMNGYERGRREAGIPCVESSVPGYRAVIIGPEHPEYAELYARNEAAADRAAIWEFETKALRGPLDTVWAWLRGERS